MVATARGARLHPAWVAAAVAFVALLCAAGFRAAPGVLMVPLRPSTAVTGISHVSLLRGRLGSRSVARLVLLLSLPDDTNLSWAMSSA
jgi:hypothetical protein